MNIRKLKNITNKIEFGKSYKTPVSKNENLPPIYNIMLVSGPKGSGKGVIINFYLQLNEKAGFKMPNGDTVEMRIIWCAGGTSKSKQNNILDELKTLDKDDRIDLDPENPNDKLKEIYEELKDERDLIKAYNIYRKVYKKYINAKDLKHLSIDELTLLNFKNYVDPKDDPDAPRTKNGKDLYHPRVIFWVADDLIGSDCFSNNKKGNFFNNIAIKSRHDSKDLVPINLIFITQSFKAIPTRIRTNTDIFILLKNANREYILDAISNEISSHFTKEELMTVYDDVMKIKYGSLILSIHKKELPENRIRIGWDQVVVRDPKYILDD
jgi:hypothetical protein